MAYEAEESVQETGNLDVAARAWTLVRPAMERLVRVLAEQISGDDEGGPALEPSRDLVRSILDRLLNSVQGPDDGGWSRSDGGLSAEDLGRVYERLLEEAETSSRGSGAWASSRPSTGLWKNRRRQGRYYTPVWLCRLLVEHTLGPLTAEAVPGGRRVRKPEEILSIRVCDPSMGTGVFLVQACRYLASRLVESWAVHGYGEQVSGEDHAGGGPSDSNGRLEVALRMVAHRCLYGVDVDRGAVEVARAALWVLSPGAGAPFTFLSDHLKVGNALAGRDEDRVPLPANGIAHNPSSANPSIPSFRWEEAFPEVFRREREGFDAIVGNPPYVSFYSRESAAADWLEETGRSFRTHFGSLEGAEVLGGRVNTFLLFLVQATRLLGKGARAGFVLPDSLLTNESYVGLRRLLTSKGWLEAVWRFRERVFRGATVGTCVVAWGATPAQGVILRDVLDHDTNGIVRETVVHVTHADLLARPHVTWLPVSGLRGFVCPTIALGDIAFIKDGINPGPRAVRQRLCTDREEDTACRKLIRGEDVTPYRITWRNRWVRYDPSILSREDKKRGASLRQQWIFESPRIVYRQTATRPIAAVDLAQHYTLNSVHNIVLKAHEEEVLFALCAYLNSDVCAQVYRERTGEVRKVFPQVHISAMKTLPVPAPLARSGHRVTRRLAELAKRSSRDVPWQERDCLAREIERLVMQLVASAG